MRSPSSSRHSTKSSTPHQHLLSAIFTDLLPSKPFQNSQTGTCWGSATGSSGKNKVHEIYFHVIPICLPQLFSRVLLLQKLRVGALSTDGFCSHWQMCAVYFQKCLFKNNANFSFPSAGHHCFSKRVDEAKWFCTGLLILDFQCSICKLLLHLQQCSPLKRYIFTQNIWR